MCSIVAGHVVFTAHVLADLFIRRKGCRWVGAAINAAVDMNLGAGRELALEPAQGNATWELIIRLLHDGPARDGHGHGGRIHAPDNQRPLWGIDALDQAAHRKHLIGRLAHRGRHRSFLTEDKVEHQRGRIKRNDNEHHHRDDKRR